MDEALQLGMDWIWARIRELASLLRALLAGASRAQAGACLLAAPQVLHHAVLPCQRSFPSVAAQDVERCQGEPSMMQPQGVPKQWNRLPDEPVIALAAALNVCRRARLPHARPWPHAVRHRGVHAGGSACHRSARAPARARLQRVGLQVQLHAAGLSGARLRGHPACPCPLPCVLHAPLLTCPLGCRSCRLCRPAESLQPCTLGAVNPECTVS